MPHYEVKLSIIIEADDVKDAIDTVENLEGRDFDIDSIEEN